jgi:hypothetical protein
VSGAIAAILQKAFSKVHASMVLETGQSKNAGSDVAASIVMYTGE